MQLEAVADIVTAAMWVCSLTTAELVLVSFLLASGQQSTGKPARKE